jgi:hypothetical protein
MANVRSKLRKMGNLSSVRLSRAYVSQFKFEKSPPPVICEQPQFSDYQDGLRKQQLVFEFDVKTWEVGHHFCIFDDLILSVGTVCLGSDQNIQHYRSHHSTKSESGQLEWKVVRVMADDQLTMCMIRTRYLVLYL